MVSVPIQNWDLVYLCSIINFGFIDGSCRPHFDVVTSKSVIKVLSCLLLIVLQKKTIYIIKLAFCVGLRLALGIGLALKVILGSKY